jgi:hypothetical protein
MRKSVLFLTAFFLLTSYSCQQKVDVEKEKAAIIQVLNEEGSAFAANDLEKVLALHVQDEMDTRYDGDKIYKGWGEIKSLYESYIERNKQDTIYTNPRNIKENIILKVTGNTAWLMCDNIWRYDVNKEVQEWKNIQISFLEKTDNGWKFSFNAFVPLPEEEKEEE